MKENNFCKKVNIPFSEDTYFSCTKTHKQKDCAFFREKGFSCANNPFMTDVCKSKEAQKDLLL